MRDRLLILSCRLVRLLQPLQCVALCIHSVAWSQLATAGSAVENAIAVTNSTCEPHTAPSCVAIAALPASSCC